MRTRILAVLVVGAGGGCSSESPAEAYGKAICERSFACCDAAELAGHEREQCEENTSMGIQQAIEAAEQAEKDGRLAYSSAKLESCAKAIKKIDCANWPGELDTIPACHEYITPKVSPGGTCDEDFECVDGYCVAESSTCAAYAAVNQACDPFSGPMCGAGLHCDGSTLLCAARLATGATCTAAAECLSGVCNGVCAEKPCYQGCASSPGAVGAALALLVLLVVRRRAPVRSSCPADRLGTA